MRSHIYDDNENQAGINSQIVSLVNAMIAVEECTEPVKGLSEHTVRQLVALKKIPYIRTGQGKHSKILIEKSALLSYFGGAA